MMKALVVHKPGDFCVEPQWERPKAKPGWAVVKVAFCGVCGSDIPRFANTQNYFHPCILGHEFSGVVEEVEANAAVQKGDKVAVLPIIPCGKCPGCETRQPFNCQQYQFVGSRNNGGFAQYCLVPVGNLFKLPQAMALEEASLIEPLLVALHCVRRSGFQAGGQAVVYGAGPIGLLVAGWLRVFGAARVAVADVRDFSVTIARACGFEAYQTLKEPLEGAFDYAFEAAGNGKALESAVGVLRHDGVLTVVGRDVRDTVIPVKVFETLMRKQLTLNGCWGYNDAGEHSFLYQVLEKGLFPLKELISGVCSLDEAPAIIWKMINREMEYCKVLVRCNE